MGSVGSAVLIVVPLIEISLPVLAPANCATSNSANGAILVPHVIEVLPVATT